MVYLKNKNFLWIFLLAFLSCSSFAAMRLELTHGVHAALPIAILPLSGEANLSSSEKISSIIQNDLAMSGAFSIINTQSAMPLAAGATPQAGLWKSRGADSLLFGTIASSANGQQQVSIELVDTVGKNTVLLQRQFRVNKADLHRLAHHIADLVYEKLTGEQGIFSSRIAYIAVERQGKMARYTLRVADIDGQHARALLQSSQPIMSPAWSPDGKYIAYVSFEKKRAQIYTVDIRNGERRLITSFEGINSSPAWSPDGRQLALVLSKSGHPKIYLADLTTNSITRLTDGTSIDTEPAFSPDGKKILFTSDRGGSPQVYQLTLGSGRVERLTFKGSYNSSATYAPNGRSIVLLHRGQQGFKLAQQDLSSGNMRSIIAQASNPKSPALAPNGQFILYSDQKGYRRVLSITSLDGRVQRIIPTPAGVEIQEPVWSPLPMRS